MSRPRIDAWASAGSSPLGSGATVRLFPSSNWISAVASEIVFTTPTPYCGCLTFIAMCKASIFIGRKIAVQKEVKKRQVLGRSPCAENAASVPKLGVTRNWSKLVEWPVAGERFLGRSEEHT